MLLGEAAPPPTDFIPYVCFCVYRGLSRCCLQTTLATATVVASPLMWIKNAASAMPAQALQVAACEGMGVTAVGAGSGYLALACSVSDATVPSVVVRGVLSVGRAGRWTGLCARVCVCMLPSRHRVCVLLGLILGVSYVWFAYFFPSNSLGRSQA